MQPPVSSPLRILAGIPPVGIRLFLFFSFLPRSKGNVITFIIPNFIE